MITKHEFGGIRNEEGGDAGGGGAAVADPVADPSTPPSFDASGIFNRDGKFTDIGERYKTDDVDADYINRYFKDKTPSDVAKILKDNQVAARSKSVTYPGADATEDDWTRYRSAVGVPESVEQVMPEDFESFQNATGWTPEVATPVIDAMIKAGAPGPVISASIAAVQAAAENQGQQWAAQAQEAQEAAKAQVLEAFGTEMAEKVNSATTAAEKLAMKAGLTQEQIEDVKAGVAEIRNPAITRMFAELSGTIQEAAYRGPSATSKAEEFMPPKELANAIMNDENHPMNAKFMAGDDEVNDYVNDLLLKASKM